LLFDSVTGVLDSRMQAAPQTRRCRAPMGRAGIPMPRSGRAPRPLSALLALSPGNSQPHLLIASTQALQSLCPPVRPQPPPLTSYHLTQCCRAHNCQARGRRFKSRLRRFCSLHPTYLQLWASWVPGEESWGRSKTGEVSQEGQMKT